MHRLPPQPPARPRPRRRHAASFGVAVLAATGLLGATACSGSDPGPSATATTVPADEGTPVRGRTLTVGVDAESNGWDPVRSNFALSGSVVASSIYDSLLAFDGQRQLVPNLAESVTPNADGTVWTIRVRDGVRFHDGSPLDAAAIKLNIDKRIASPLASNSIKPIREAVVIDDRTVEVRMSTPWFGYDYTLAAQGGLIAAPATLESEDGPTKPIGTGPFRFVSWTPGGTLEVARNDGYWKPAADGSKLPYLDGIRFTVLTDPRARQTALEAGDVEMIFTSNTDTISAMQRKPGFETVIDGANFEATAMLNEAVAPFDNDDAREALALATDRDAIVDVLGADLVKVASGPYSPNEAWYVEDTGFPARDLDAAKAAAAAYQSATGQPLSFTLKVTAGDDLQRVAELLQAQWAEAGITAEIVPIEQSGYIGQVVVGDYQAAMFRNFTYVFPDSNYIFWHSSTAQGPGKVSTNFTQTRSEGLDTALDAGRSTSDPAVLREQYAKAQRALNAELAYIWLYHQVWAIIADDDVNGLGPAATGGFARTDAKPWWSQVWMAPAS